MNSTNSRFRDQVRGPCLFAEKYPGPFCGSGFVPKVSYCMIKNYLGEGYFDFGFFGGNTEFCGYSMKNHVQKSP